MNFFKNSKNIILSIILALCIGMLAFILLYEPKEKVYSIDFSKMTENEIKTWAKNNNVEDYLKIDYVYSDKVKENGFVSQSIKENVEINNEFVIYISKGIDPNNLVEMIDINTVNLKELQKFFNDNGFSDVTYEYVVSEKEYDSIIKINKTGKVSKNDPILVTLSKGINENDEMVIVPDFSNYDKKQINKWCETNSIEIEFTTNFSDTVEFNGVVSQSVKPNEKIKRNSKITICLSDGKPVEIIDINNKNKEDIEKWSKESELMDVSYVEEYSDDVKEGQIIAIKPKTGVKISIDYPVIVTVSKGKKVVIEIKSGQENKTIDEFKKYIEDQGLLVQDSGAKFYSDSISKDHIFNYSTGNFSKGDTIKYSLSLGKYSFDASKYNGKTLANAKEIANGEINKEAFKSFSTINEETSDSNKLDVTSGCELTNSKVTCKIGVVKVNDFNGMTKDAAKNYMNKVNVTFEWGEINVENANKTYGCVLDGSTNVKCKVYRQSMNVDSYNGISKDEAISKLSTYKNTYGTGSITFTEVETNDNSLANKTYGCSLSGYDIKCNVYKYVEIKTASIMSPAMYTSFQKDSSFEATKTALLEGPFKEFSDVSVVGDSESEKTPGTIISISVNGTNISSQVTVPITSKIVITLSK